MSEIRQCVRCGRDLRVTKAVDKSGLEIAIPEQIICGCCLTSNEKAEVEMITKKSAEIRICGESTASPFDKMTPIVLLNELPLVRGSDQNTGAGFYDYYWCDSSHEIIGLNFTLKPMDRLSVIYRCSALLPTERVDVLIRNHVKANTPFHVRTLVIQEVAAIRAKAEIKEGGD